MVDRDEIAAALDPFIARGFLPGDAADAVLDLLNQGRQVPPGRFLLESDPPALRAHATDRAPEAAPAGVAEAKALREALYDAEAVLEGCSDGADPLPIATTLREGAARARAALAAPPAPTTTEAAETVRRVRS